MDIGSTLSSRKSCLPDQGTVKAFIGVQRGLQLPIGSKLTVLIGMALASTNFRLHVTIIHSLDHVPGDLGLTFPHLNLCSNGVLSGWWPPYILEGISPKAIPQLGLGPTTRE